MIYRTALFGLAPGVFEDTLKPKPLLPLSQNEIEDDRQILASMPPLPQSLSVIEGARQADTHTAAQLPLESWCLVCNDLVKHIVEIIGMAKQGRAMGHSMWLLVGRP